MTQISFSKFMSKQWEEAEKACLGVLFGLHFGPLITILTPILMPLLYLME